MAILKHYQQVIHTFHNGHTLFRKYKKTVGVLKKYEKVHYEAWIGIVELSSKSMQVGYVLGFSH